MGAIPFLPMPVPLGTLAEYLEQDDGNWMQVPTGTQGDNVLVIPSQLYRPVGNSCCTFDVFGADCPFPISFACEVIVHDATLGGVFQLASAAGGPHNCVDWLNDPLCGDGNLSCFELSVMTAEACDGTSIAGGCDPNLSYPEWYIQLAGATDEDVFAFDYLTIWCNPIQALLPNFIIPPPPVVTLPPPPPACTSSCCALCRAAGLA